MQAPKSIDGVVRGLHHVAIAVPSLAEARRAYEDALGLSASPIEFVEDQKVNVLVLYAGAQRIELVEPASPDSPISDFLAKARRRHPPPRVAGRRRRGGDRAARAGRRADDRPVPRPGAHGTRIAFVHPKSTGGVLMELVEEPVSGVRDRA
jgi:methylmalonyl-CoA/ethylmalonyl-CoA epimerase